MLHKQLLTLAGMLAAIAVCLAFGLYGGWGAPAEPPVTTGDKLAYATRWLLVPGLCLFVGIAMTAALRFFMREAIDGSHRVENRAFEINQRYNQNTLEQLVLAAIAWTGLAVRLPEDQLSVIARCAVLFGVGRIAFWLGYLYAPWARGFGMGLTFYPTLAALIYLAFAVFR